jgi:hypothetical protein
MMRALIRYGSASLVSAAVLAAGLLAAPGREARVTERASGTFDVKLTPQTIDGNPDPAAVGRRSGEKH